MLALIALPVSAGAQLAYFGSTIGLSCTHPNDANGSCAASATVLANDGTTLRMRYAMNANADGPNFLLLNDFEYTPTLSFTVSAPGAVRLDVSASIDGDLSIGESNCSFAANWFSFVGSVRDSDGNERTAFTLLPSGGYRTPSDPPPGEHVFDNTAFQSTTIVSDGAPQLHSIALSWSGSLSSNACEMAIRLGAPNASTANCPVCGYPGSPARTQADDGIVLTVTATSLCGDGNLDSDVGEEYDLGVANGPSSTCDSGCHFTCPSAPRTSCRLGTVDSGILAMSYHPDAPEKNSLVWKWIKGEATDFSDLGTPGGDPKRFRLCVWDGAGHLMLQPEVERPSSCDTCWRETARGYAFRDKSGQSQGITNLVLKDGADGEAKIVLKAKGDFLDAPPLPPVQSPGAVTAQLFNHDGTACWGATYSTPAKKQSSTVWRDRND